MSSYKFFAVALVVGIIGPLFWLGVNVFENWLKRRVFPRFRSSFPGTSALLLKEIGGRKTGKSTEKLGGPRRVGE